MRSTITDTGRSLLAQVQLGEISMEFCEVRTGNGIYETTEAISSLTALKSEKNTYSISSAAEKDYGLLLSMVIANIDGEGQSVVDEDYNINEIGLYVAVDNTKYLYVVAVADDDSGSLLPAYTGNNPMEYVEKFPLTITNTASITVDVGGAYALASDLLQTTTALNTHIADTTTHVTSAEKATYTGDEPCTTTFNVDGSITETYSDRIRNTVFNADGTITETLENPTTHTVYMTKTTTFNIDGSITVTIANT